MQVVLGETKHVLEPGELAHLINPSASTFKVRNLRIEILIWFTLVRNLPSSPTQSWAACTTSTLSAACRITQVRQKTKRVVLELAKLDATRKWNKLTAL